MARVTAAEAAEKWGRRLKGSTEDIRRGVEKVDEAPGVAAARASDRMVAGVQEAVGSGRWGAAVSSVTAQEWKEKTIQKGIGRISQGVDSAMPGMTQTMGEVLAAVDKAVSETDRIPRGGLEDNINRMTTFVRSMAANAPSKRRR